ncbi:MAG: response regulator [Treponemataceae bacterium]
MSRESEFLTRLRETFKAEAEEHRAAILAGLLELEKGESGKERDSAIIEIIFREAHSLKGAARAVDIGGIERLCQTVESIFSTLKKGNRRPERKIFDSLYKAMDLIGEMTNGTVPVSETELGALLKLLKSQAETESVIDDAPRSAGVPSRKTTVTMPDTVRISAKRLGSIYLQAEEMLSVKQSMARHASELNELQTLQGGWHKSWIKISPTIRKMRDQSANNAPMTKVVDFLDSYMAYGISVRQKLEVMSTEAVLDNLHTGERVDSLLAEIKTALILPFSVLLESFPRMIRDLAVEEGKEVLWAVQGDDVQIDKRVLEKIKDPLIHIVRNSISHGIEKIGEREKHGKPRAGTISLHIERADNDTIELTVADDGAGVDLTQVRAAAVAKGFLTDVEAEALNDRDALELIFLSELSTSPLITAISGRGLGLAIARENIETVGGALSVETTQGKGTVFRIRIPLSLATFRGVLVKSRDHLFVIPTVNIDQVLNVEESSVVFIETRESIPLSGRAVSLVNLGDVLGLKAVPREKRDTERFLAIVLFVSGTRIAYRIDAVLGEQEVLAKKLGGQLIRVRNLIGATVLVTGEVVPILNPYDLSKSVPLTPGPAPVTDINVTSEETNRKILVADDSATSRMLLKSLLESAGYQVQTAVDGAEAYASLRVEKFDLLVSDIEMPRMNGFVLCEKVRGLTKTADLPIVLVSSLGSQEDREKGIEAGANAYIAKSRFDQSNLLDAVKRLL